MDRKAMLTQIDEEIERLAQARRLLAGMDGASGRASLPGSSMQSRQSTPRKRRRMSAAGRRRISEAQKKRWAARKKAGKT
jgi:hypothetical protein